MLIGIDRDNGLVYECANHSGHGGRPLWPTPVLTPASFFSIETGSFPTPHSSRAQDVECWFREDHFDPISRLRRGRFYSRQNLNNLNPEWAVLPLPSVRSRQGEMNDGFTRLDLWTYSSLPLRPAQSEYKNKALVLLGIEEASSVWNIVVSEAISTGEEMVTLKARQSFGVLPEIDWSKVPTSFREKVRETIGTLLDDVHRAGPESVIDRSRDAVAAILRAHLGKDYAGKDLGKLIKVLAKEASEGRKQIIISASEIIRVFHPRAKPNEQERRELRSVREQDAELAVQCVGTVLCELGWGEW